MRIDSLCRFSLRTFLLSIANLLVKEDSLACKSSNYNYTMKTSGKTVHAPTKSKRTPYLWSFSLFFRKGQKRPG
jgi:hypothetical protein